MYYSFQNENFFFSSTLKPIILNQKINKKIDQKTLNNFFKYGYCSDNKSIFQNINKVPANSILSLNLNNWELKISKINNFKKNLVVVVLVGTVEFLIFIPLQHCFRTQKHVKKFFYLLSSFFFIGKI